MWSIANAFEFNPPTIYIGYDDPCFIDGGIKDSRRRRMEEDLCEDDDEDCCEDTDDCDAVFVPHGALPHKNTQGELFLDLYAYVSYVEDNAESELSFADSAIHTIDLWADENEAQHTGKAKETYIRVDMEKGKRLSALLQPENVDAAGGYITLAKLVGGAAGGDPVGMVTAIQDMASSGLSGPPLNAGTHASCVFGCWRLAQFAIQICLFCRYAGLHVQIWLGEL